MSHGCCRRLLSLSHGNGFSSQPKTSEKFGLPAKHGMPLTWFAAHHVCAAGAVGVHWLTLRCSLASSGTFRRKIRERAFPRRRHRRQHAHCGGVIKHCVILALCPNGRVCGKKIQQGVFSRLQHRVQQAQHEGVIRHPEVPRAKSAAEWEQAAKFWAESRRICDIMGNKDDLKMRSGN